MMFREIKTISCFFIISMQKKERLSAPDRRKMLRLDKTMYTKLFKSVRGLRYAVLFDCMNKSMEANSKAAGVLRRFSTCSFTADATPSTSAALLHQDIQHSASE
jgi:hypothetical protein